MHPLTYFLILGVFGISCHSSPKQSSNDASFATDSFMRSTWVRPEVSSGKCYTSLEEALQTPDSVRCLMPEKKFTEFPTEILQFPNLERLDIYINPLTEEIGALKKLKTLYCSYCGLTSLPATIGELQQLEVLWLLDNELKTLPEEIGQLKNLRELNLSSNPIETLPESFFQLKNLRRLSFSAHDFGPVFTPERQKEIRERLPLCDIDFGEEE